MSDPVADYPVKTSESQHPLLDSAVWQEFHFRPDDVFITTYQKSGTTWMQQIVSQLIFHGDESVNMQQSSLWLDGPFPSREERLAAAESFTHRRFIKTHVPVEQLVFSPIAKYIFVGRDGRDVLWSLFNHHANSKQDTIRDDVGVDSGDAIRQLPDNILDYYHQWMEQDGYPWWSFWDYIASWWKVRHLPNVLTVHFTELKQDLPKQVRRIAEFLEIDAGEDLLSTVTEHSTFDYMRAHGDSVVPHGGAIWKDGVKTFLYKGTNGRWRDTLSDGDIADYERIAVEKLGEECAHWLATGQSS